MRTKLLLVLASIAVVAMASPAGAKGPSGGTIDGEGLDAPIVIGHGEGTPGGDRLIEDVGFFDATFGQVPTRMLDGAPTEDLGPMLTLTWTVPGPNGQDDVIVQDLYPYADGGPLTYTAPGQRFFEVEETVGGWFRSPTRLLDTLQAMGLPDQDALVDDGGDGSRWAPIGASLAAVVLLGGGLALFGRRREVAPAAG